MKRNTTSILQQQKIKLSFFLDSLIDFFNFPRTANKSAQEKPIPKEAPWKTLALNERTCKGSANLDRYVWNGARARFRWNTSLLERPFGHILKIINLLSQSFDEIYYFLSKFLPLSYGR